MARAPPPATVDRIPRPASSRRFLHKRQPDPGTEDSLKFRRVRMIVLTQKLLAPRSEVLPAITFVIQRNLRLPQTRAGRPRYTDYFTSFSLPRLHVVDEPSSPEFVSGSTGEIFTRESDGGRFFQVVERMEMCGFFSCATVPSFRLVSNGVHIR